MGTWRPAADIDLAREGSGLNMSVLLALKARLADLNLPVEVDLIIRDRITNPDLERHIHTYGREWSSHAI